MAFYAIQHVARAALGDTLGELRRVLVDGGILVLAAHLGDGEVMVDELLGHRVEAMGGTFYGEDELVLELVRDGFTVELVRRREPLPHEHPSPRLYLLAR